VQLNWTGLVHNSVCVRVARVVVTRLVKGMLSDWTKSVVVAVDRSAALQGALLQLQCSDTLPYTLRVELVEAVAVNGHKKLFAERSDAVEVLLTCPWSEPPPEEEEEEEEVLKEEVEVEEEHEVEGDAEVELEEVEKEDLWTKGMDEWAAEQRGDASLAAPSASAGILLLTAIHVSLSRG
jgi:hypothetical protein